MVDREAVTDTGMFGREFIAVVCAQLAFAYAVSTFLLLPKYLSTQFAASATELGRVTAIQGIASTLVVPVVGGLVERVGRRPLMAAGALLALVYALCWIVVDRRGGLNGIGVEIYALQVLSGLAFMLANTGSSTLVADLAPPARLSQAIGVYGVSNIAMNAVAPAVSEPIAARFGWSAAFALAACASGLSLALVRRVHEPVRSLRTHSPPQTHGDLAATLAVGKRLLPYLLTTASCGAALGAVFTFYQPFVIAQGAKNVSQFF
ncbi:MAG: hypothetical protein RL701_3795, partial [Pseudomonadota bacterium]